MRLFVVLLALPVCAVILTSCETTSQSAPPVNASFLRASHRKDSDTQALATGRTVFVNRCIACHALPNVANYDAKRIPGIVGFMAERAHLTKEQKDLVTKYLLAVRSQ